jgi:hypothetical protein
MRMVRSRRGARLQDAREIAVQRGDGDAGRREAVARQRREQIQVALHAAALGDQREGVARIAHHLDQPARQKQLALHGLVAVGGRADVDRRRAVPRPRQLGAQHLGDVALGDDAGLEVQPRRQAQVAVRGPGVAIDAAVLAAAVGVHGLLEEDVRRVVAAQGAARVLPDHLGARRAGSARLLARGVPPIVEGLARLPLEAVRQPARGATALDGVHGHPDGGRRIVKGRSWGGHDTV